MLQLRPDTKQENVLGSSRAEMSWRVCQIWVIHVIHDFEMKDTCNYALRALNNDVPSHTHVHTHTHTHTHKNTVERKRFLWSNLHDNNRLACGGVQHAWPPPLFLTLTHQRCFQRYSLLAHLHFIAMNIGLFPFRSSAANSKMVLCVVPLNQSYLK